jgi:hypothetical protein
MFQTYDAHDGASSSHNQSLSDGSERLRTSVTNQDAMEYQRSQNNSGTSQGDRTAKPQYDKAAKPQDDKATDPQGEQSTRPHNPYNDAGVKIENNTINLPVVATATQFRERVQRIFGELDKDKNGFLTRRELATAVENHQYAGEDAQVVTGLYSNFDGLARVSIDQGGKETALSRRDVQMMDIRQRSEELQEADLITPWVSKNFSRLDQDSNGYIDFHEIDAAEKKSTNGKEKILYGVLKENYNAIQNANNDEWFWENDGITRADLTAYSGGDDSARFALKVLTGHKSTKDSTRRIDK